MASIVLSQEEATAYHEAGHAVMGCIRGRSPLCVSIVPDGNGNLGHTTFPNDWSDFEGYRSDSPKKREYIETRVLIELAGTIAHDLRFPGRAHDIGDERDEELAREMTQSVQLTLGRVEYIQCMRSKAQELIAKHWSWVEAVARTLIEKKEITGRDVSELRP